MQHQVSENIKEADILWFVKSKSHGKIIAVATYFVKNQLIWSTYRYFYDK
jgi:hypothetical protein